MTRPPLSDQSIEARATLAGVAAYAGRVLEVTDGLWPPQRRATACREALRTIEAECARVHAALTTEETT